MRKFVLLLVLAMLAVLFVAPAAAQSDQTIVDIAVADGRFTTLVAAVTAADLVDTLSGEGPFTVFAPTDDAFAALPEGTVASLLNDIPALTDILLYHVVAGSALAADVVGLDSVTTVQGAPITIEVVDGGVVLNGSVNVIITDIVASNGVIHVIDAVLLPPVAVQIPEEVPGTIVDIAVADGRFTTLVAAVQAAGLVEALNGEGPLTVFAPTDDAFAALPEGTVEALLGDIPALTDILLYHVVAGQALAADVVGLDSVTTLQGSDISIEVVDGGVVLNGSVNVIITDIVASNGVIHVVDAVLLPPAQPADTSPVVITAANDISVNINFRAGPSLDDAVIGSFVPGASAPVVARNAAGDWIQIDLDGQLGWVFAPLTTLSGDIQTLPIAPGTIVDIAVADGRFTTLVAAVQAAGLVEALNGEGPLTVFAPTDDAFAALPAGTVEALLGDIPALTDILLYHVVAGSALAADVVTLNSVTTLQGSDITIEVTDAGVVLNGSVNVIITDIIASNGVIHVIDAVLLAPAQ